jgi:hypothetical protein
MHLKENGMGKTSDTPTGASRYFLEHMEQKVIKVEFQKEKKI